jgi:alcohol dehydrogenase YqhD (iron-dependent ADH family)
MIKDFNFYTPTRVVFGKSSEEKIAELVMAYQPQKVLIHYGGGSAVRSGLLDVVRNQLRQAGLDFV